MAMAKERRFDPAKYQKLYRSGLRMTVPMFPYTRMVRALHAIGYTRADLMDLTGVPRRLLYQIAMGDRRDSRGRIQRNIHMETAKTIKRVFDTYSVQPRHNTPSARRARTMAEGYGWAPPMAWDDMYDPNDQPKGWGDRCAVCPNKASGSRFCRRHKHLQVEEEEAA